MNNITELPTYCCKFSRNMTLVAGRVSARLYPAVGIFVSGLVVVHHGRNS